MKTRGVAFAAIFASLYFVLGIVWPLSFMDIQCRIACGLIPLIAIFGWPATVGISIGHFLFNLSSPIGFLDFLSPFVFLIPRILIQKYGVKAMPLHTISVALWVPYILNQTFGIPILPTIITVGVGELLAEWYLGYILLYSGVETRWNLISRYLK